MRHLLQQEEENKLQLEELFSRPLNTLYCIDF